MFITAARGAIKMDREYVIMVLQSILLSCKSDMDVHDLFQEFRENFEFNISIRTFVDFLHASGCFVITPTNDGLMVWSKSKLQYPRTRTPLEIIYENDRAWRYGIQSIRKQIQPRRNRRAVGTAGIQRRPLTQTQKKSIGYQNNSNNRIDRGSVGHVNEVITVEEPMRPAQERNAQRDCTTTKHCKLSKFSQALMRAMATEPDDLMPLPEPDPEPQVCIHLDD